MVELVLCFAAGYIVARAIDAKHKKADMLLYWNVDCLAWRPVSHLGKDLDPDLRYLAAYEVDAPVLISEDYTITQDGSR